MPVVPKSPVVVRQYSESVLLPSLWSTKSPRTLSFCKPTAVKFVANVITAHDLTAFEASGYPRPRRTSTCGVAISQTKKYTSFSNPCDDEHQSYYMTCMQKTQDQSTYADGCRRPNTKLLPMSPNKDVYTSRQSAKINFFLLRTNNSLPTSISSHLSCTKCIYKNAQCLMLFKKEPCPQQHHVSMATPLLRKRLCSFQSTY
jgi:hypothetical protein